MRPTIRLITVLCYFLPFTFFMTTCNRFNLYEAYNKKEAEKNNLLAQESDKPYSDSATTDPAQKAGNQIADTSHGAIIEKKDSIEMVKPNASNSSSDYSFWEKVKIKMVMPTDSSLSGIGSIFFYKNISGQVFIAVSLLLSLILLFAWKFLKRKKTRWYLLLANLICVLAFVMDSFFSEVSLLYGTWVALALLGFQLVVEINDRKKISMQ